MPRPPEIALALFLNAGLFKGDPRLAWIPLDLTLVTAALTTSFVLWELGGRKTISRGMWWPFGLIGVFVPCLAVTDWNPYAQEKVLRFFTLTAVAAIAPVVLFRD